MSLYSKSCNFYNLGRFKEVVELNGLNKDIIYMIGSLVFIGQHERARELFRENKRDFDLKELIFCRFHLGISYTRTSEYSQAKNCFLENLKYRFHPEVKNEDKILIYQGLSFYRYFFSLHHSSLYFARKAEKHLLKLKSKNYLFGALINDILAHNFYQLGMPAKGKIYSENALRIVTEGKLDNFIYEFKATQEIYESEFNLNVDNNIKKLKKAFRETPETNDYTLSELVLQVSKQLLLGGKYKKANEYLIKNFSLVYKNDNKRKVAKLNTLLAQFLIFKHQFIEALSLLKVARSNLDPEIDLSLLSPIVGLEKKCLLKLGENFSEQDRELIRISEKTDKALIQKEYYRHDSRKVLTNTEDQLSRLFDNAVEKSVSIIDEIIKYKLFHLIRFFCTNMEKKQLIFIHPQGNGVFLIDQDEVIYKNVSLSRNQLRALELLNISGHTKESLVMSIWGYSSYEPIRHDHLVYSLIKTIRKNLGEKGEWIRSNGEDAYYLDENTEIILNTSAKKIKKENLREFKDDRPLSTFSEDLNFRQIQVLQGAFSEPFSASEASKYFKINRMTAYRDLTELVSKGLLLKRGKLKGTKYYLDI